MSGKKKQERALVTKSTSESDVFGCGKTYHFLKLRTKAGVKLFHEYSSLLLLSMDQLVEIFEKNEDKKKARQKMIAIFQQFFDEDQLFVIAQRMLAGGSIDDQEIDGEGMCELFGEDPMEIYDALFWAVVANYPKYVDPFLARLGECQSPTEGSTLDSSPAKPVKV